MNGWASILLVVCFLVAGIWLVANMVATGYSLRVKRHQKLTFYAATALLFLEGILCAHVLGHFDRMFFAGMFALSGYVYRNHRKNENTGKYKDGEILPPFHHLMFKWIFFVHVLFSVGLVVNWIHHGRR